MVPFYQAEKDCRDGNSERFRSAYTVQQQAKVHPKRSEHGYGFDDPEDPDINWDGSENDYPEDYSDSGHFPMPDPLKAGSASPAVETSTTVTEPESSTVKSDPITTTAEPAPPVTTTAEPAPPVTAPLVTTSLPPPLPTLTLSTEAKSTEAETSQTSPGVRRDLSLDFSQESSSQTGAPTDVETLLGHHPVERTSCGEFLHPTDKRSILMGQQHASEEQVIVLIFK